MNTNARMDQAWLVSPDDYLAAREIAFSAPASPASTYLTMRDGVKLALDWYVPDAPEGGAAPNTFPTIFIQTPYYRRFRLAPDADASAEPSPNIASFRDLFVPRGYALVALDVRGSGASFGVREGFRSPVEREDGREVADWIVRQPWSNGRIGATGISYVGAASDFLASTGHPAVKAIAPLFSVWDTHSDHYYPGGILLNNLAEAYDRLMVALDQDRRDLLGAFAYFRSPYFRGPMPVDEDPQGDLVAAAIHQHRGNFHMPDFIREFAFKGDGLPYDPAFTSDAFSPYAYMDGVSEDLACLGVSGWYDGAGFSNAAITRFRSMPIRRKHLLLGPWDHGARTDVSPFTGGTVNFPVLGEVLRFFDHYLAGRNNGYGDEKPVHYYAIGSECWRSAESWPPPGENFRLHLSGDGTLSRPRPHQAVTRHATDFSLGTGANTRFARLQAATVENYYDDWDGRADAMANFVSLPLQSDFDLTGHPVVTLKVSIDQADAAIHVYLEDIDETGHSFYVTEGMLRALHRNEQTAPANQNVVGPYRSFRRSDALPMQEGVAATLRLSLFPISWTFAKGHRIRLSICGADADNCIQVPHGRPPQFTIHHGGADGSFIDLPGEKV